MELINRYLKGVPLPFYSISFENRKFIIARREGKGIKNFIIEEMEEEIIKLENGEWKINLDKNRIDNLSRKLKASNIESFVTLIPDFLTNVFIFNFDILPKKDDMEKIFKWRLEKQFPFKEDFIFRYKVFKKNKNLKVLTVSIQKSIIGGLLNFLAEIGINSNFITPSIFTLYNFIKNFSNTKNGLIIVNRLSNGTSFFGLSQISPVISRCKIGRLSRDEVIEEAISTMKWIQEKEGVVVDEVWIRDLVEEDWDELEKPFISLSSLEREFKNIKILSPHLGVPEWTE